MILLSPAANRRDRKSLWTPVRVGTHSTFVLVHSRAQLMSAKATSSGTIYLLVVWRAYVYSVIVPGLLVVNFVAHKMQRLIGLFDSR